MSLKQGKIVPPTQGDKFSSGSDTLYLLMRPKAHFYAAKRESKDCTHESAFPNKYVSPREECQLIQGVS